MTLNTTVTRPLGGDQWGAAQPEPKHQLMEEHMFVAIAQFRKVPAALEQDFHAWFAWSNGQLREIDGLQGRRLLRATDGTYTALVEHQSAETFAAMHLNEVASLVHARLGQVLHDDPMATKYEVVADFTKSGSCCGGGGGHAGMLGTNGPLPAAVSSRRLPETAARSLTGIRAETRLP